MQAEVKDAYWKIFDTSDLTTGPGPKLVEIIDARISEMATKYGAAYPSAMKCPATDAEGLTAYLRFPAGLTLVWAVLDRASAGWRGFTMTADGLRLLQDLRRSLLQPPRQLRPRATKTPADDVPEDVRATA
jgi:putative transposase